MNVGQDSGSKNDDDVSGVSNVIRIPPPVDVSNAPRSIVDSPLKNSALSPEIANNQNLGQFGFVYPDFEIKASFIKDNYDFARLVIIIFKIYHIYNATLLPGIEGLYLNSKAKR